MGIEMLVLADDFTGALDTGVQFAKNGVRTKVTADPEIDFGKTDDARILVIDTETRHQSPEQAQKTVALLVGKAAAAGITLFYKKTDSALRGNAGAEMDALLEASGGKRIHFFPAFPLMQRTVKKGILYIDGIPVAQSVFGKDPFDPVTESYIPAILQTQTNLPVMSAAEGISGENGIIVYDTETNEQLKKLVSGIRRTDEVMLLAGCAGLASCFPFGLMGNSPVPERGKYVRRGGLLVINGSVNAVTRKQLAYARNKGFGYTRLNNRQKLTGWIRTEEGRLWLEKILHEVRGNDRFLVDTNDAEEEECALDFGKDRGMDALQTGSTVADTLAYIVKQLLERGVDCPLLLTGGDVLYHAMREMGISEVTPLSEADSGVIEAEFLYRGKKCRILTKSGGFGNEDVLVRLSKGSLIER